MNESESGPRRGVSPTAGSHWLGPMMPSARAPSSSPNAARPAATSASTVLSGRVARSRATARSSSNVPTLTTRSGSHMAALRQSALASRSGDSNGTTRTSTQPAARAPSAAPRRPRWRRSRRRRAEPSPDSRPERGAAPMRGATAGSRRTRHAHHSPSSRLENGVRRAQRVNARLQSALTTRPALSLAGPTCPVPNSATLGMRLLADGGTEKGHGNRLGSVYVPTFSAARWHRGESEINDIHALAAACVSDWTSE